MKAMITALLLLAATAQAQTTYQDRAAWEAATSGDRTVLDFAALTPGDLVGTYQGVAFDSSDRVDAGPEYLLDGLGVEGLGMIRIDLPVPATAIGIDHPAAARITLYESNGSPVLYTSDFCGEANGPPGAFCGVTSPIPFSYVVIQDWWTGLAQADTILFYTSVDPGLEVCSSGALPYARVLYDAFTNELLHYEIYPDIGDCSQWGNLPPGLYRTDVYDYVIGD